MTDALKQLSDAMAAAVEVVSPALVTIHARHRLPATGIAWSADGLVITAHHVVERDEQIRLTLHDGSTVDAELVGRDPQNDLALLKTSAGLVPARWGADNSLKIGNLVLALGKAGGQVQATLGVVSALVSSAAPIDRGEKRRHKHGGRRMMQVLVDGYIQTDVVMYPGFSGGPLISGEGAVYGLNTSGFGRGASIAVPVTTIRNTISTLQKHGKMKQGYLGVGVQPVHLPPAAAGELEQETGLLIVSVEADSPAANAGLLVGDIIVTLDGEPTELLEELLALLGSRAGATIPLRIVRGGELKTVSATIGERG